MSVAEPLPEPAPPQSGGRASQSIIALLLLAPLISEVLYGATRLSAIFAVIPQVMTWGCGALLIREAVRRWRKDWRSMLLLGLALAVAEEWIIQQTSIAPLVAGPGIPYGRVWGVNWIYFLWALGYESIWVVLIPVQLTELLFPAWREKSWLRTKGLAVAGCVFVFGACIAWYGWTQTARPAIFHLPPYTPSALFIAMATAAILLLILAAYWLPSESAHLTPMRLTPTTLGSIAFALGLPWTAFVLLGYGAFPRIPIHIALIAGLLWSALAFMLARQCASRTSPPDWNDSHRFALVFGGTLACMAGGFAIFWIGGALTIDWIGKAVMDGGAIAWLLWFNEQRSSRRRG